MKLVKKIQKMKTKADIKIGIMRKEVMIDELAKEYVKCKHSGLASERAKCEEIAAAIEALRLRKALHEVQYDLI